mmetsp:Transcript_17124/g.55629  ORF Transcript_17124/g.55629 Transcript_17124/m.55629 type:complete len:462 (+) Transcript_17124:863-2248(+)
MAYCLKGEEGGEEVVVGAEPERGPPEVDRDEEDAGPEEEGGGGGELEEFFDGPEDEEDQGRVGDGGRGDEVARGHGGGEQGDGEQVPEVVLPGEQRSVWVVFFLYEVKVGGDEFRHAEGDGAKDGDGRSEGHGDALGEGLSSGGIGAEEEDRGDLAAGDGGLREEADEVAEEEGVDDEAEVGVDGGDGEEAEELGLRGDGDGGEVRREPGRDELNDGSVALLVDEGAATRASQGPDEGGGRRDEGAEGGDLPRGKRRQRGPRRLADAVGRDAEEEGVGDERSHSGDHRAEPLEDRGEPLEDRSEELRAGRSQGDRDAQQSEHGDDVDERQEPQEVPEGGPALGELRHGLRDARQVRLREVDAAQQTRRLDFVPPLHGPPQREGRRHRPRHQGPQPGCVFPRLEADDDPQHSPHLLRRLGQPCPHRRRLNQHQPAHPAVERRQTQPHEREQPPFVRGSIANG